MARSWSRGFGRMLPCLGLSALAACAVAPPGEEGSPPPAPAEDSAKSAEGHSALGAILLYLPNRVFDVLDIVRARARIGPGFAISARATELLDVNMGVYKSFFVGLPGPRGEPRIPWPLGIEQLEGMEVSAADDTTEEQEHGPRYGPLEVGAGVQALIVGVDVGVDVYEVLDLVLGFIGVDPVRDDF
ncbi:MAG: hypothetical protein ACF8XB_08360 [Planctomycetota bacterium JB042]